MKIIPYDPSYDKRLQELSEYSQKGNISFSLCRKPNFYQGAFIQTKEPEIQLIVSDKQLIGCINIGRKDVWFLGKKESMVYLCDLKIHPNFQNGSAFIHIVRITYEKLQTESLPAPLIMFSENKPILTIISGRENKRKSLKIFHAHKIGNITTTLIERNNKLKAGSKYKIFEASYNDIEKVQSFIDKESKKIDFFPVYDLNNLGNKHNKDLKINDFYIAEKEGEIVGCFALWDLRKVKQIKVVGYSKSFKFLKPFYNFWASITGRFKLKEIGEEIKNIYISCLLIKDREASIYEEMLSAVLNNERLDAYDYLLSSLDIRDPLQEVHGKIRKKREIAGEFYVGHRNEEREEFTRAAYFYVEAARI